MHHALYLLLGGNLGDIRQTFALVRQQLTERVGTIEQASGLYETTAWGVTEQPAYLNQVLRLDTSLSPEEVLVQTQGIEQALGRVRLERWGARVIDIDLLFYDDLVFTTATLTLPHPLLHQRRFTLVPLAELAPSLIHPVLGQSVTALLAAVQDDGHVVRAN